MPQNDKRNIRPTVRPLPYYGVAGSLQDKILAKHLRAEVSAKIARRLPGHHLGSWSHRRIVESVKKCKQEFPFFLKLDIAQFYPSVEHSNLVVGAQIAYRDLLGLEYVPQAFKRKYVGALQQWTESLPLHKGIPLGNPLSALLAPLMLVPLWLEVKRIYHTPLLVYMDDVLVFCKSPEQTAQVYNLIESRLWYNYQLKINTGKLQSGRFSRAKLQYCGWEFSGGYARINPRKVANFKERLQKKLRSKRPKEQATVFLKRVNRSIDGFANYYKHGQVRKQFTELDAFVRTCVRPHLKSQFGLNVQHNKKLEALGLHSLLNCYDRLHQRSHKTQPRPSLRSYLKHEQPPSGVSERTQLELNQLCENSKKMNRQLAELIALNKKILKQLDLIYA